MEINEKHNVRVVFVEKSYGQLNENKIAHTCVCVLMLVKSFKWMVPWLAKVSWIKIIVFTYICGYVCVHMNDGLWVWVFAFIKSALCFFLKILATASPIDERKFASLPFES